MDKVDAYDKEQLQAMGWLFDEIETPDTAVRFVEQGLTSEQQMQDYIKQTLTDAQKQQARTNMGVQSADELLENADFIAQLKTKLGL